MSEAKSGGQKLWNYRELQNGLRDKHISLVKALFLSNPKHLTNNFHVFQLFISIPLLSYIKYHSGPTKNLILISHDTEKNYCCGFQITIKFDV